MKLHLLIIAALLFLPITSAAGNDDITKELITSKGKKTLGARTSRPL